ncbi:MAG: anthrax toxin-like adenylyl cyclase domain-containing protein [Pseudomonadota bacterium]
MARKANIDFFKLIYENNPPYADEAFQSVADRNKVIIVLREPNLYSFALIEEGYETKSRDVKAKTSSEGITAGFVVKEALFGKGGRKDFKAQEERIAKSIEAGCGFVPLNITDERIDFLERENLITIKSAFKNAGRQIKSLKASYDGDSYRFELKQSKDDLRFWEVWYNNQPVMALANPGQTGKRAAVVSDYDLFAIFFRKNLSSGTRAVTIPPRLRSGSGPFITKLFHHYIDSIPKPDKRIIEMDKEKGNISFQEGKIIEELNRELKQAGYKGKALVWHGTETANPDSPGPDFPLLVYIPKANQSLKIENKGQLVRFYKSLESSDYQREENRRFSLPTFRTRANTI